MVLNDWRLNTVSQKCGCPRRRKPYGGIEKINLSGFNPGTLIAFRLPANSYATVKIYDTFRGEIRSDTSGG